MVNFSLFGTACEITCLNCNGTKLVQSTCTYNCACLCPTTDKPYIGAIPDCKECKGGGFYTKIRQKTCSDCKGTGVLLTFFGKEVLAFMLRHVDVKAKWNDWDNNTKLVMKD